LEFVRPAYIVVHIAWSASEKLTAAMIENPSAPDLEKAYQILSEFGLLIGPAGKHSDVVARAIAAGIALGRSEALADKRPKKK
jgi:hypothetical protein